MCKMIKKTFEISFKEAREDGWYSLSKKEVNENK